jgi:hypothetical protein
MEGNNRDESTDCKRGGRLDNHAVSGARLSAVGLAKSYRQRLLGKGLSSLGLSRLVSDRGRVRGTHCVGASPVTTARWLRRELVCYVMLGAIFTHYTHNETSRLPFNLLLLALSLVIVFTRLPAFLKKRIPGKAV